MRPRRHLALHQCRSAALGDAGARPGVVSPYSRTTPAERPSLLKGLCRRSDTGFTAGEARARAHERGRSERRPRSRSRTDCSAHIYHPVGVGAVPTIVERTPYGRTNLNAGMAWHLSRAGRRGVRIVLAYSDLIADGRASDPEVWDHRLELPPEVPRLPSNHRRSSVGSRPTHPCPGTPGACNALKPAPAGPNRGAGRTAPAWTRGCCPPAGAVAP